MPVNNINLFLKISNLYQSGIFETLVWTITSDESEPSWLEPELELKDFQLGSARDLFPFSSKSKIGRKQAEILMITLISRKKLGGYRIMRYTVIVQTSVSKMPD